MRLLFHRARAYWLMIHPFPVMMVVTFATILGVASARESLDISRLVRAIATLFFSQVVVGISNDYHDRALDAQGQPWKPLASGIVKPNEALALIVAAFLLMIAVATTLGTIAFVFALIGTFAGLLYNYWLRETPFSWFPYVLGFSVLPIFIWISIDKFDFKQLWLYPIGLPLLIGVHLAQTLPDVETDRAVGAFGLAATLGRERGIKAVWCACACALILAIGTAIFLHSNLQIVIAAAIVSLALVAASAGVYFRAPISATLRTNFRLIALNAVILIAGWLAALRIQ